MGLTIEDGTGSGKSAAVTGRNELAVRATTHTEEHDVSIAEGQTYFLNITQTADTLTTATGNTYNILYLQNNSSSRKLVVEKVLSSANGAGGVMGWIKNPTVGTIGAANETSPVNLNFSSGNVADITAYVWDETGTDGITGFTGGTKIKTFITGVGFTIHPIDGAIILGQGDRMLIYYTNGTGGSIEFECGVRFYFDDDE